MADQQYCLRWNNHQPTLAGCFDRMLKDDQFTDCTLSAEGVNVVAHRMLLSACSPYFNELFKEYNKQQFPIVILRDVSVVELKALMDYMYRGEVNISQDQLADLLKVAEMLQIKGLYEAGFSESRASAPPPAAPRISTGIAVSRPQPLDLPPDITSDGAASPAPRRRKRVRRRSSSDDFPSTIDVAAEPIGQAVAPATAKTETVNNILSVSSLPVPPKLEEHQFDVVLPKEEYVDDQDSIENITLDDDDMDEMDQAGPSHGDGSSQGYPPSWHQSDRSTEDLFLSAQDSINNAGGAQRDSQVRPASTPGTVEPPEEIFLKDEPFEVHDETVVAEPQSTPFGGTCLEGIKPYKVGSENHGLSNSVPMVRLERVELTVRSSARLSARKSAPGLRATSQAEEKNAPHEPSAAETPTVPEPPSNRKPKAGPRRYKLILPKPSTSPGTAVVRRRKLRSKSCDRIATNPLPAPIKIMPAPPPTIVVAQQPQQQAVIVPQQQAVIVPQPQAVVVPQPTAAIMLPHFVNGTLVAPGPLPKGVKWPLPPKQTQSSVSSITVVSDMSTPPLAAGLQRSKAKQARKSVGPKTAVASDFTPQKQPILSKEVARPVTNGYQCCFCNCLLGSMAELMMHLRTCSGLAAARM